MTEVRQKKQLINEDLLNSSTDRKEHSEEAISIIESSVEKMKDSSKKKKKQNAFKIKPDKTKKSN